MKWEILKGSEKDFEGAPEWVTIKTFVDGGFFWLEKNEECANYLEVGVGTFYIGKIRLIPSHAELIAERRPITEPESVLPASGSEMELDCGVEFYTNDGNYCFEEGTRVIVGGTVNFGLGDFLAVKVKGTNVITDVNPVFLRPIRSTEDVARDAAAEAMRDSVLSSDESLTCYQVIYCAIAAGKIPGVKLE